MQHTREKTTGASQQTTSLFRVGVYKRRGCTKMRSCLNPSRRHTRNIYRRTERDPRPSEARRRLSRLLFTSRTRTRSRMSGGHRMSGAVRISVRETTEESSISPDVRSWPDVRSLTRISSEVSRPLLNLDQNITNSTLRQIPCSMIFNKSPESTKKNTCWRQ